jgi:hypothetical protein
MSLSSPGSWPRELLDGIDAPPTSCSGLDAPSPSVCISSNDVIQTPGSRGFYEHNGELHLPKKFKDNFSTMRAILNCAKKDSLNENIFIFFMGFIRGSASQEAVRVRIRLNS